MAPSLNRQIARARAQGVDAVDRVMVHAAAAGGIDAATASALLAQARAEAARRDVGFVEGAGWLRDDDEADSGPNTGLFVIGGERRDYTPRVTNLKMAGLISSACSAVGATLGALSAPGWALVALAAGIALYEFWKKRVTFEGLHGQLLFELYRSTDSGQAHAVEPDHLFANVNASREQARMAPVDRKDFDAALSMLTANGMIELRTADGTLRWSDMAVELP